MGQRALRRTTGTTSQTDRQAGGGWAEALLSVLLLVVMSITQYDHREWSSMDVSVELTDEGVAHVDDVIRTIYHYIHMLRYGRHTCHTTQPGRQAGGL